MEITLDTSAIISVISNEKSKQKIIDISTGCSLIAPNSVHWEIGNAFSAMIKRKRITLSQVKECLITYRQILIKYVDVDLIQTMELVNSLKIYAYDAYLIRCSLEFNAPLLTLDSRLKYAANRLGVEILEV